MKHSQSRNSYSLVDMMKKIIFIAIPIILINIVISSVSILNIRQQNHAAILNAVTLYQDDLSIKLKAIERFVQWTVVQEPLVETLENAGTEYERSEALNALRTRVNDNQYATGTEFQYFLFLEEENDFYNTSSLNFSWADYVATKEYFMDYVHSDTSASDNFTWRTLTINDSIYLYYLINYNNRSFATMVNAKDLAAPLSKISLGKKGFLEIADLNDEVLFSAQESQNTDRYHSNSFFYTLFTFQGTDYKLPFNIHLYSDNFSNYGQLLLFQIFVILTAVGLCFILSLFIVYMYQKVIKPIQAFSDALSNLNEQEELINLQSNNIRELEQASSQFKNLIREIKKLKINIYEHELEEKRFQITFLQNQIRPHFYLNCLTTIGSMAQLGNFKDINSMVIFTSRYLRYLFQTDKEMVRIEYELSHIQAYLDIQSLRYCSTFLYDCSIQKEDEAALIPPLLLITFVENILKHSITDEESLRITLSVKRERTPETDCLKIDIIDSGQGFSEEILDKLSRGESLNTTTTSHIGITNSIQRLSLLYGTKYKIAFFNEKNGGAHICMHLPYQLQEEET